MIFFSFSPSHIYDKTQTKTRICWIPVVNSIINQTVKHYLNIKSVSQCPKLKSQLIAPCYYTRMCPARCVPCPAPCASSSASPLQLHELCSKLFNENHFSKQNFVTWCSSMIWLPKPKIPNQPFDMNTYNLQKNLVAQHTSTLHLSETKSCGKNVLFFNLVWYCAIFGCHNFLTDLKKLSSNNTFTF